MKYSLPGGLISNLFHMKLTTNLIRIVGKMNLAK
uniref:Uncharacterized protein n=1 Tax=Arundo donax TaxID=35708 RepID=A0A0A9GU33_ARUDO